MNDGLLHLLPSCYLLQAIAAILMEATNAWKTVESAWKTAETDLCTLLATPRLRLTFEPTMATELPLLDYHDDNRQ